MRLPTLSRYIIEESNYQALWRQVRMRCYQAAPYRRHVVLGTCTLVALRHRFRYDRRGACAARAILRTTMSKT
jgi:hypothetical protein